MSGETASPQSRERREYAMIDEDDRVDVASFDSFPASDPPAWIATDIGSTQPYINERQSPGATTPRTSR